MTYSDELRAKVQKMIRKQMKEMDADKDYLGEKLPVPKLPVLESPWCKAEMERVLAAREPTSASQDVLMTASTVKQYETPVAEPGQDI